MLVKRILVIVVSFVLGAILTVGIIHLPLVDTTVAEYGTFYFLMTSFFLGCAIGIWLDKFLGTNFLPD